MSEPITNENYAEEMNAVVLGVQMLAMSRAEELLTMVVRAETLAPMLDPTAYMRGGDRRLDEQRRILEKVVALIKVWQKIQDENTAVSRVG